MDETKYFRAPLPSRATRQAPKRSRVANRSTLVARLPAYERPIKIVAHSGLELSTAFCLLAQRDTYDLIGQPHEISFRRPDGRLSSHTYDYWHQSNDGTTTAFIVKPFAKTKQSGFHELCQAIKAATPPSFAERVFLVTEKNFSKDHVWNAARFYDYRRIVDPELDAKVFGMVCRSDCPIAISQLQEQTGLAGYLYQAAVRLIFEGKLKCLDRGRILPSSRVQTGKYLQ